GAAWPPSPPSGRGAVAPTLPAARSATGRIAMALLGWPPLGLAVAAAIGEETGCGRFAASCGELSSPGTWIVHAAIILLLVALPPVAAWSAHGTIAALVAGVPAAIEMFRRLVADGLVRQADGRDLILTAAGRAAADTIFRRHALLEWLLTSVIGLGWAESDEEAARLQGALSPRVEARLDEMLGH